MPVDLLWTLGRFVLGLALVLHFAERLVEGVIGTSRSLGLGTFLISVVFIGFDPENLAVGAVASSDGITGIALGSVIGAAMVAIALAFGITALFAPMEFEQAPKRILVLPTAAVLLFGLLSLDGRLSRLDGAFLIAGYIAAILYILYLSGRGTSVQSTAGEEVERAERLGRWTALGLLVLSLAAIIVGSELVVGASETLIARLGISDTLYGMTILAFLVSIEEVARELPAALEGRSEISFGNVIGSVFAFFLLNAGVIALVAPVPVQRQILAFHLPVALGTTVLITLVMLTRKVSRRAGVLLVLVYVGFVVGNYMLGAGPGGVPGG